MTPYVFFLGLIALFWGAIHLIRIRLRQSPSHFALPLTATARASSRSESKVSAFTDTVTLYTSRRSQTTLTLRAFHLSLSTGALNAYHARLSAYLAEKGDQTVSKSLTNFYDLGSMLGFAGLLSSLVMIIWTAMRLTWNLASIPRGPGGLLNADIVSPFNKTTNFVKRATDAARLSNATSPQFASPDSPITVLIPGLTVPLTHLPIMVFALFAAQIMHEMGHALSATLPPSLAVQKAGASLTLILPSCFVALSHPITPHAARERLRVIAAGPYHNLVLLLVLLPLPFLLRHTPFLPLLYEDVSTWARVVVSVDEDSPLYPHLPPSSLITALNDVRLSQKIQYTPGLSETEGDTWFVYLNSPPSTFSSTRGWCVDKAWFLDQPQSCCAPDPERPTLTPPQIQLACFASSLPLSPAHSQCLDPLPILSPPSTATALPRCSLRKGDDEQCDEQDICVRLADREEDEFLRIRAKVRSEESEGEEKTILWKGPRREVYEQVHVSTLLPLSRLAPLKFPIFMNLLYEYLITLTLTLYLFNLLPLPYLDGSHFLDALLDLPLFSRFLWGSSAIVEDLELYDFDQIPDLGAAEEEGRGIYGGALRSALSDRRTPRNWRWSKCSVVRFVRITTSGLTGLCVLLTLINWLVY